MGSKSHLKIHQTFYTILWLFNKKWTTKRVNLIDFLTAILWAQNVPLSHFLYYWRALKHFYQLPLPSTNFYQLWLLFTNSYFLSPVFTNCYTTFINFFLLVINFYQHLLNVTLNLPTSHQLLPLFCHLLTTTHQFLCYDKIYYYIFNA